MSLGWLDLTVIAVYFAVTVGIGFWFGRGERTTHDFFLGARRQHWLLAGISIIATEVSALTVIAVPGDAFASDWSYIQMYAGSFVGRVLIVLLLLPAFYGGSVTTVYEYLGQRFGPCTRTTASIMFFASRVFGSGIRLLVAALALAAVFGWSLEFVVILCAGVSMVYATFGGIKAILWTDAFQAAVFVGAALIAIAYLFHLTPGAWNENLAAAYDAGKFHAFTWGWSWNNDKMFWILTIHALFVTMAAMGTDQDLTQRMLTCPDLRASQRSLLFNAFAGLPIVCTFLLIGTLLWVYYTVAGQPLPDAVLKRRELIFPHFIASAVPHNIALKGLLVTAILAAAMGSLSSAVGALASTAINDLYKPFFSRLRSEAHYLAAARLATVFFGVILIVVALAFQRAEQSLLWAVFQWVSLVFGGMLGVFLLGVTTRQRGHDGLNMVAMLSSTAILVALKFYQESMDKVWIAWPWWIVIGTGWTYLLGALGRSKNAEPKSHNAEIRK